MNYKLSNLKIETAKGARISGTEGNEYLSAVASNPMNIYEKKHRIAVFDEVVVNMFKAKLPESRGGLLPDEGWDEESIPLKDRMFPNGCVVDYDLGKPYYRKYTSDIVDENGHTIPGKAEGDPIRDANGRIKIITSVPIFCQYQFKVESLIDDFGMPIIDEKTGRFKVRIIRDKDGNPIQTWVDGWMPEQVGEAYRNLLTPLTDDVLVSNENPLDDAEEVEVITTDDVFSDDDAEDADAEKAEAKA